MSATTERNRSRCCVVFPRHAACAGKT